jgi:hypothetical protein
MILSIMRMIEPVHNTQSQEDGNDRPGFLPVSGVGLSCLNP